MSSRTGDTGGRTGPADGAHARQTDTVLQRQARDVEGMLVWCKWDIYTGNVKRMHWAVPAPGVAVCIGIGKG